MYKGANQDDPHLHLEGGLKFCHQPQKGGIILLLEDTCLVADGYSVAAHLVFHVCSMTVTIYGQQQTSVAQSR